MNIPEKYLNFEKSILQTKIDRLIENKKIKVTNKNFQNIINYSKNYYKYNILFLIKRN